MSKDVKNELVTLDETARLKAVTKYQNTVAKCNRTAWELAKVVYETVNSDKFNAAFRNLQDYAETIGVTKSAVSRMNNAYKKRLLLDEGRPAFSVGQLQEMIAVNDEKINDFVEWAGVDEKTNTKDIRALVKEYTKDEESTPDVAIEDETPEEVTEDTAKEVTEDTPEVVVKIGEWEFSSNDKNVAKAIQRYIEQNYL